MPASNVYSLQGNLEKCSQSDWYRANLTKISQFCKAVSLVYVKWGIEWCCLVDIAHCLHPFYKTIRTIKLSDERYECYNGLIMKRDCYKLLWKKKKIKKNSQVCSKTRVTIRCVYHRLVLHEEHVNAVLSANANSRKQKKKQVQGVVVWRLFKIIITRLSIG